MSCARKNRSGSQHVRRRAGVCRHEGGYVSGRKQEHDEAAATVHSQLCHNNCRHLHSKRLLRLARLLQHFPCDVDPKHIPGAARFIFDDPRCTCVLEGCTCGRVSTADRQFVQCEKQCMFAFSLLQSRRSKFVRQHHTHTSTQCARVRWPIIFSPFKHISSSLRPPQVAVACDVADNNDVLRCAVTVWHCPPNDLVHEHSCDVGAWAGR